MSEGLLVSSTMVEDHSLGALAGALEGALQAAG
jgi:hypothetical protein